MMPCLQIMLSRMIFVLYGPEINLMFGNLILDLTPGDSQKNGGFSLVSMGIFQRLFDYVSLEGRKNFVKAPGKFLHDTYPCAEWKSTTPT
jgi:hypothetical protein